MSNELPNPASSAEITFNRVNPRVNEAFGVKFIIAGEKLAGIAIEASAYGATCKTEKEVYEKISAHVADQPEIKITTNVNALDAVINRLWERDGAFFISLKLADGHTWYS